MAIAVDVFKRPPPTADYAAPSRYRPAGIAIGLVGVAAAVVALGANVVAAGGSGADRAATLAWSFGLNTAALAALKVGIAFTLVGILVRLWLRVESVKAALPGLKAEAGREPSASGEISTPYGRATTSAKAPELLFVHRAAKALWALMVVMGAMAVAAALVLSIGQSGTSDGASFTRLGAWVQGLGFLGEGLLLAGISFLLGTILAALRSGGGEVQESLGVTVKTLRMPTSAKLFLALMMLGVVVVMAQFVLYLVAAYADVDQNLWFAWLGPLRELGLGILLSGIVLALYAIGTVLGFQFTRIKEIIVTGR